MTAVTTLPTWRRCLFSSSSSSFLASSSSLSRRLVRLRAAPSTRRPFLHLAAAALGQSPRGDPTHTLTTVRTLPYVDRDLFRIIADVDAYAAFLPHCTVSRVTHWRQERSTSSTWPARADLTVGWGPLSQTYSSRVYCIPSRGVVEAVSGQGGVPTLTADERAELGLADHDRNREMQEDAAEAIRVGAGRPEDDPFESLVTRWTVAPMDGSKPATETVPWSRVELRIRFQFRNPLYQLAAAQVGNEMATKMIEAFEKRAATLLGPQRGQL